MKPKKKGQMQVWGLVVLIIALAVVGLVGTFTLKIQSEVASGLTPGTVEANATVDSMKGIAEVTGWQPTIGTIGVAVIIIGMLVAGLGGIAYAKTHR